MSTHDMLETIRKTKTSFVKPKISCTYCNQILEIHEVIVVTSSVTTLEVPIEIRVKPHTCTK
ncbi:MAG: hypothetical protein ACFFDT_00270 [Candidatus Hodarchaeota archaeon]